jgi:phospholipase/carboxylesterase
VLPYNLLVSLPSKCRRWLVLASLGVLVAAVVYWRPWREHLRVIEAGGKGPPTLVLLHGFGSAAEQWLPFSKTVPLLANTRFVFPQAPLAMRRIDGGPEGHAWWDLKLAEHRRADRPGVDLRGESTAGLVRAGELVKDLLEHVGGDQGQPVILGGFSQGAMVSCQVAFSATRPLAALILLSGTPHNEAAWRAGMAHGRSDDVLPFDLAEGLRDEMRAAGLDVTFVAFDGGHAIPEEVVVALRAFLRKLG